MKKFLVFFLAVGLVIGSMSMANATPVLRLLGDYLGDVTITDNSVGLYKDSNPAFGVIEYEVSTSNWWLIATAGTTKPAIGSALEPYLGVTVEASSNWGGSLDVWFSETDFTGARPTGFDTAVSGVVSGSKNGVNIESSYSSPGQAGVLGTFAFGPGTFGAAVNEDSFTGGGTYSLTLHGTFTNAGQGESDFKAEINPIASTPEPATMLLLGSGLVGLAGFRKKFKK